MKLTISRTKGRKGIFRSVTVYYLNVEIDVTSEEMALLEKAGRTCNGWEYMGSSGVNVIMYGPDRRQLTARNFVGRNTCWKFATVEDLEKMEGQVILRMKDLKQQLGQLGLQKRQQIENATKLKQQAADFTSEGPHEIEL